MAKINRIKSVTGLIRPHAGKWVTLSSDKTRVLGVSKRMETALSQAQKKGEPRPLLIKVPDATTAAFFY
jgi:hypothetical protein